MFHRENPAGHTVFSGILPSILLFLLFVVFILPEQGCKKDAAFDSSAVTLNQLKGTWRGRITTFKNNTRIEKNGDVSFFNNLAGDLLNGIFDLGQINFLEGFMFQNGTLYFNLILSDSTNPQCSNWNLGGYVYLQEENLMVVRIAGNECGPLGKQFVTYEGYLILINPDMDPSAYFSFAQTGRAWTYETQLYNGTFCEVQQTITAEPSPYLYTVTETNNCGWPFAQRQFNWQVEPFRVSVMAETSATEVLYAFYLDAVLDKTYRFINGDDTTYLTLTDTDVPVNVTAGSYTCGKYTIESRMHSSGDVTSQGTIYLSKQYGFIKMDYSAPSDSSNIQSQALSAVLYP
ncbi:MAG: hypothetical protein JXA23_00830 [Bacteroidales bacterium]|nr:hypothetical protein [Bacteroidales bacterium]